MTPEKNWYTFDEAKDQVIGPVGTPERDSYEFELKMTLISDAIKSARKERNLTQSELGEMIGVKKAQISRLEKGAQNVTIATIQKVFQALNARVSFQVEFL
ncbi:MAG: helix-turn-helix domain-containing protein [Bacteroidia bacterium]